MYTIHSDISIAVRQRTPNGRKRLVYKKTCASYAFIVFNQGKIIHNQVGLLNLTKGANASAAEVQSLNMAYSAIPDQDEVVLQTDVGPLHRLLQKAEKGAYWKETGLRNELSKLLYHRNRSHSCRIQKVSNRNTRHSQCHRNARALMRFERWRRTGDTKINHSDIDTLLQLQKRGVLKVDYPNRLFQRILDVIDRQAVA